MDASKSSHWVATQVIIVPACPMCGTERVYLRGRSRDGGRVRYYTCRSCGQRFKAVVATGENLTRNRNVRKCPVVGGDS